MPKKRKYLLNDFDFDLPDELIAQYPVEQRDHSRLFVLDRKSDTSEHEMFYNCISYLNKGDVLVFNNAKVIAARIYVTRPTGGKVEIILTQKLTDNRWLVLSNRTKRLQKDEVLRSEIDPDVRFKITARVDRYLEIQSNVDLTDDLLLNIGKVPLPPYIHRDNDHNDHKRYQTVYASESGAVAAPTAGLHFTEELLDAIKSKGVIPVYLTLYVSWGTFQPVRNEDISKHDMHSEQYYLSDDAAATINRARKNGNRIIAVGTTSIRVLESTYRNDLQYPGCGSTDIFIYPPYTFKAVDAVITNFHTPQSTLLMLICAFAGYDRVMGAYREAVELQYRFYSYGDAMLII